MTFANGNPDPAIMGQASKYDRVKLVNWISTLPMPYMYTYNRMSKPKNLLFIFTLKPV